MHRYICAVWKEGPKEEIYRVVKNTKGVSMCVPDFFACGTDYIWDQIYELYCWENKVYVRRKWLFYTVYLTNPSSENVHLFKDC